MGQERVISVRPRNCGLTKKDRPVFQMIHGGSDHAKFILDKEADTRAESLYFDCPEFKGIDRKVKKPEIIFTTSPNNQLQVLCNSQACRFNVSK